MCVYVRRAPDSPFSVGLRDRQHGAWPNHHGHLTRFGALQDTRRFQGAVSVQCCDCALMWKCQWSQQSVHVVSWRVITCRNRNKRTQLRWGNIRTTLVPVNLTSKPTLPASPFLHCLRGVVRIYTTRKFMIKWTVFCSSKTLEQNAQVSYVLSVCLFRPMDVRSPSIRKIFLLIWTEKTSFICQIRSCRWGL